LRSNITQRSGDVRRRTATLRFTVQAKRESLLVLTAIPPWY
jgi:hypothetical protein